MKRTVAKVAHKGTYRVVYDDSMDYNKYNIYHETYSDGKHTRLIARYEDLASCMFFLGGIIVEGA